LGVPTNRDDVAYSFDAKRLAERVETFCGNYNAEVDRYNHLRKKPEGEALDAFLDYSKVKWSRDLKKDLARGRYADFEDALMMRFIETGSSVAAVYRPPVGTKARTGAHRAPLQNADLKVGATIPLSYRVEDKMRLSKDRRSLKVNDSLTLGGIPPEAFECRLGNRSALEWVIDQYQVTEDKRIYPKKLRMSVDPRRRSTTKEMANRADTGTPRAPFCLDKRLKPC
jgi:predicted helicase